MDVPVVHQYLSERSYWAQGISYEIVDNSLTHSFCVGAFLHGQQIGFGRLITDYHTFAWFADFFVQEAYQGQGVAKQMLTYILDLPWSQKLRRKMLCTSTAHTLYQQFKFSGLTNPTSMMEIYQPAIHLQTE